jgi:hypothetical protein
MIKHYTYGVNGNQSYTFGVNGNQMDGLKDKWQDRRDGRKKARREEGK